MSKCYTENVLNLLSGSKSNVRRPKMDIVYSVMDIVSVIVYSVIDISLNIENYNTTVYSVVLQNRKSC